MPNLYVPLADLKADLNKTGTADDASILRIAEGVSREIDLRTRQRFFSWTGTRYFDGIAAGTRAPALLTLPNPDGAIISISSLTVDDNGDGVYETALSENTDFWVLPTNRVDEPGYQLLLNPTNSSPVLSSWPRGARRVAIVGTFGHSSLWDAAGALNNGGTLSSGATTATLGGSHAVQTGDTILIDSEQIYVSAVSSNTATLVRGQNGTTAASHTTTASVSRRRYPAAIERLASLLASRLVRDLQTGASGQVGQGAFGYAFREMYPAIRDLIEDHWLPTVA